jgi:UDP-N-acetylmuramate dehydrogenase
LHNRIQGRTIIEENSDHVIVEFGGGENWHETVLYTLEKGWGGLENLSLIPGTVGASPIQNIGAYGVEIKDTFHALTAFHIPTGTFHTLYHSDCAFGYRDSVFKSEKKGQYFITAVQFKLSKQPVIKTQYGDIQATLDGWGISEPSIRDISNAVIHIRQSKLPNPAEIGNCGSFFKNPVVDSQIIPALTVQYPDIKTFPAGEGLTKVPAGWLIEKAGWKGFKRNQIGVHAKQALVLVNYGGGTGAEIIALAKEIQADIFQKFGIELEMEVNAW